MWSRFRVCATSPSDCAQFVNDSVGRALTYLLLLSLVLGMLTSIGVLVNYLTAINQVRQAMEHDMPDFSIKDGVFEFEHEMPYVVDQGTGWLFIIDTTGQTSQEILSEYVSGIFINSDTILFKDKGTLESINLADLAPVTITKNTLDNWLVIAKYLAIPGVLIWLLVFFVGKVLSALIVAVLGLVAANSFSIQLSYKRLFVLAVYSLTIPSLARLVHTYLGFTIPYFWLLYFAVAAVCIVLAVKATPPYLTVEQENQV